MKRGNILVVLFVFLIIGINFTGVVSAAQVSDSTVPHPSRCNDAEWNIGAPNGNTCTGIQRVTANSFIPTTGCGIPYELLNYSVANLNNFCKRYTGNQYSYASKTDIHSCCTGTCGFATWLPSGWSCSYHVPAGSRSAAQYVDCGINCAPPCTPKTCAQLGAQCGNIDNGCGTQINCGDCNYCTTNPPPIKTSEDTRWFSTDDIYYAPNTKPSDDSCGYYADAPTANRVCQLKGYDGISSWTPQYNFYTSPGDNCMLKWNGNNLDRIPAESYNTGVDTVTCKKAVYCQPQCIGKRPTDSDGCGGTCSSCLVEKKCVVNKCTTDTACFENQTIMKVNSATKLGALWNQGGSLSPICYSEIFNKYYDGTGLHDCKKPRNIVSLNSASESRVSNSSGSGFDIPVCYGNLSCRTVNSPISVGLVASYSFENSVEDNSGLSNDGIVNGPTFDSGRTGLGANFDGINDYISSPTVTLPTGSVMTVSAWIYPTQQTDSTYNGIVSWGPRTCTANNFLLSLQKNGRPSMASWCNDFVPATGPTVNFNEWNYIAAVLNGNSITLYVNNESVSGTLTSVPNVQSMKLAIGSTDYPGRHFNGSIDEVKIWNRALSPQEIEKEYLGTNKYCDSDEKVIAKLSDSTNALITKANEVIYPVQLCCKNKNKDQMVIAANWTNMKDAIISKADLNDSVKLMVFGNEMQNVNYTIYKDGTYWWNRDKVVAQTSTKGYLIWQAKNSGTYYFKAQVEGDNELKQSNNLVVFSSENNSNPTIKIIKPAKETTYVIDTTTGSTAVPSFEEISSDEDDDLSVTWNFGENQSLTISNCSSEDCNTSYAYSTSGTKLIRATAKEMSRSQSTIDISRIFVYKEGLNIFAIIDSPDYKTIIQEIGNYFIDGRSSHVANCSLNLSKCTAGANPVSCYTITDSVTSQKIYCYKFAESSDNRFGFKWTIENKVDNEHTNFRYFNKSFIIPKDYPINLRVNFTF